MNLKPFQKQALSTLQNADAIDLAVIAPTGSGKGVILEELAVSGNERILLLSPLVALGRQFQQRLLRRGVPVSCRMGLTDLILRPTDRVWILSPESLQNGRIQSEIAEWKPTLIVVDEAHCIEEWGDRFRPEFGQLPHWIASEGYRRTLWMSATFPKTTRNRIETALQRPLVVEGEFSVPAGLEIDVECLAWSDRWDELVEWIETVNEPGIIFTGTRELTDRVANFLAMMGKDAIRYHAGMSRDERMITERRLELRPGATVVATSAFGMGMDYPQFRWAVILQPTYSLLGLIQSAGRIARNGLAAQARVFWHPEDFQRLVRQLGDDVGSIRKLAPLRRYLESAAEDRETVLKEHLL